MNDNQLFQAAKQMRSMGSFAASIAEAYFVADTTNRETLLQAFKGLFERAYEVNNPKTPASEMQAFGAALNFHHEWSKTRDYMLTVVQADGPCTLQHVLRDCKLQGYTKGIVQALQSLKDEKLVITEEEDGETIIELTNKGCAA